MDRFIPVLFSPRCADSPVIEILPAVEVLGY